MIKLTLEQKLELDSKAKYYGSAFAIQYKDGSIKILGLKELLEGAV